MSLEACKTSFLYFSRHYLDYDEPIVDGFFDGGRDSKFQLLSGHVRTPALTAVREVILVDSSKDKPLDTFFAFRGQVCRHEPQVWYNR